MSLERFKPNCRMRGHKAARLGKGEFPRLPSAKRAFTPAF
jgi:hypothetical protein